MPIRLFWMFILVLGVLCGGPLVKSGHASAERDYTNGWNEFHRLLKDSGQARDRNAWLAVRNMFNSAYQKAPQGPEAPKSLFYLGRVHEEMGVRFGQSADFAQAVDYYGRVALRFANHTWADDALLRKAKIHLEHMNDSAQAYIDLLSIVHNHSKGDMAPKAQAMLRELDSAFLAKVNASGAGSGTAAAATTSNSNPTSGPTSSSATAPVVQAALSDIATSRPRPTVQNSGEARLMQVRYWSSDEYTRVVLDVDADVDYTHRLLNPDPELGTPHRLMIDLQGTVLGPEAPAQLSVADGILRQVRTGQNQPDVSRVVLDIQRLADFRVFTLEGPFRIVVDISGGGGTTTMAGVQPPQSSRPAGGAATPPQITPRSGDIAGSLIEQLGLKVKTIMIDPGHGGKDPGAVANGLKEKDVNLRMSRILGRMLEEKGFRVLYTRTTDVFIPLEERTAMANAQKADLFLSIHANAHPNPNMKGFEIYSLNLARNQDAVRIAARENAVSSKNISDLQLILTDLMLNSKITESKELATKIHGRTISGMRRTHPNLADRGVREAPFYVLMGAKMPAVLIEMGYLTNREEARLLATDAYLRTLASNLLQGVLAYRDYIERHAKL
ncbi:N-acetylmuramoyl-L-alanine amidase [Desulfonatronum thioautotrophicum]|uniref:N-acetylmuramoyl-L-alanine amidase n=1 Tax=Desulfonatronum thioautotrophicum TaxID=617001 RepID=UPI0005EB3F43|nr:N-acetylmuramoyl-L-alanine amidase [Desulfonatronum thioautotrophicum]